jgi:hypothetical protein
MSTNSTKIASTAFTKSPNHEEYEKISDLTWRAKGIYIPHNSIQLLEVERLMTEYSEAKVSIECYTEMSDYTNTYHIIIIFKNKADEAYFVLKESGKSMECN